MREEHHDLGGDPGPPSGARQSRAPRDSLHFGPPLAGEQCRLERNCVYAMHSYIHTSS